MSTKIANSRVAVLGGAGFVGSHLIERVIELGASDVVIVDNFQFGHYENVPKGVPVYQLDCRNFGNCVSAMFKADIVFHLAANNGGRGYLEKHPTELWGNVELDSTIFRACEYANVRKVVFFSSSCVYPDYDIPFFDEDMVDYENIEQADGPYGMAKLVGEHVLNSYVQSGKFDGVVVRPFNMYGPRMKENKAITALVAKSFVKMEPFEVWGSGQQFIDWIYVDDAIDAVILATEKMGSGVVNVGTGISHTPVEAVMEIWDYVGWIPKETYFTQDKAGYSKIADVSRLRELGWMQKIPFVRGIHRVVDWYYDTHVVEKVRNTLGHKLVE